MAYESFKTRGLTENVEVEEPKSFRKGATVNFLNPSPYLFWITIGGPIIINAYAESVLSPILFLIGFYALLVGSKIASGLCNKQITRFHNWKDLYLYNANSWSRACDLCSLFLQSRRSTLNKVKD